MHTYTAADVVDGEVYGPRHVAGPAITAARQQAAKAADGDAGGGGDGGGVGHVGPSGVGAEAVDQGEHGGGGTHHAGELHKAWLGEAGPMPGVITQQVDDTCSDAAVTQHMALGFEEHVAKFGADEASDDGDGAQLATHGPGERRPPASQQAHADADTDDDGGAGQQAPRRHGPDDGVHLAVMAFAAPRTKPGRASTAERGHGTT